MLKFYSLLTLRSESFLNQLLKNRLSRGKEDGNRIDERKGFAGIKRPEGTLIWLHAASVGEAQSAMILIHSLLKQFDDIHILVTTGTKTSAKRMQDALPERAFHQYIPLDHPLWVQRFLDHWNPDSVFWMESELWPNMLLDLKKRNIPSVLVNARLSQKSFIRWSLFKNTIRSILSAFSLILAQSKNDADNFEKLGAKNVIACGNIKYSAAPLSHDENTLQSLNAVIGNRPVVAYASTHDNEEEIAADIHDILENTFPNLLTVIIPRHPERGQTILEDLESQHHGTVLRGEKHALPDDKTRIYIANTLGEMGLFYRLADIVYVGRSLSKDGGGGHNPLEPAQLNCAVIHGCYIQNLQDIYHDMQSSNACIQVQNHDELLQKIEWLLSNPTAKDGFIQRAHSFASAKSHVIDTVLEHALPKIDKGESHAA